MIYQQKSRYAKYARYAKIRGNVKIEEYLKLIKRKQKAENLPENELKIWKTEYDKIIARIIQLEKELHLPFDNAKAEELLQNAIWCGPGYLNKREVKLLNQNAELDNRYGLQLIEIARIYNEGISITELEKEVNKYSEIRKEIIEKAKG